MTLRDQLARFHAAITGAAPLDSARDLVEAGAISSELERLHVYEHAYTARIASVLVHDYPKLARLVGECVLRSWTASYLRAYPPSSFTLREAGANLARWLEADHAASASSELRADLARIERARHEVFDGPDATPLTRDDLATLAPAEFPSLKLRLVPSSRVVTITTNADDIWDAIENENGNENVIGNENTATENVATGGAIIPSVVDPKRTILVWRRELTVIHRTLEPDEGPIVETMIAGTTFGAACELLESAERAVELLVRWLDAAIVRA